MSFSPYFWLYMGSICVNLVMIAYMLKRRRADGAAAFVAVLFCCSLWSFACAMESGLADPAAKLLWARISYPAHTFGPVAWFIMILQLTEHGHFTSRRNSLLLCAVPIITSLLAITDFHGLMYTGSRLVRRGSIAVMSFTFGPWFWIHAVYATGLDILSVVLALRFWKRQAPHYGKRYACLVFPVVLVWLVNTAYLLKFGPPVDLTPVAWGASTPFVLWALFRDSLFDLVPIARESVMENLTSGIILLDLKDRIVDINPAAVELFHCQPDKAIGLGAQEFFTDRPELLRQINGDIRQDEFKLSGEQADKYYISTCYDVRRKDAVLGKMLIIRDITQERLLQAELLSTQRTLAVQDERERMARDLHDDMGQIMGFVNVQSQAVLEYLKHGRIETAEECLERLSSVAREAHNNVRETILAMRGETAVNTLIAAKYYQKLEQELRLFERNNGIRVEKNFDDTNGSSEWRSKPAMQILKIIREALNNIQKHSGAAEVSVMCRENDSFLTVEISDNGCGFEIDSKVPEGHFGLLFMRERAEEMGGRLSVDSKAEAGTTVKLEIPLSAVLAKEVIQL